jgi:hypothetical protein
VLGGGLLISALVPHDLLEAPLEVGTLQARAAAREVLGEVRRAGRVEFPVHVVLDLVEHLFAINL